ncbi:trypsin-like serine protease [Alcanivorax sp. IO_7]|nr:trypsin-like serine protease [Alcanivorax sp. IO_7]
MIRWTPVLLSLLCAPAWAQTAEPRIIGGDNAPAGQWPWMAQVDVFFTASNEVGLCGGSHIARNWIITAGHCVVDENDERVGDNDVSIRLGSVFSIEKDNLMPAPVIQALVYTLPTTLFVPRAASSTTTSPWCASTARP